MRKRCLLEKESFLLPESHFREITDQIRDLGVDTALLYADCDIDASLPSEGALGLTYAGFRRLLIETKRLSQEPALGWLIGRRLSSGCTGY